MPYDDVGNDAEFNGRCRDIHSLIRRCSWAYQAPVRPAVYMVLPRGGGGWGGGDGVSDPVSLV